MCTPMHIRAEGVNSRELSDIDRWIADEGEVGVVTQQPQTEQPHNIPSKRHKNPHSSKTQYHPTDSVIIHRHYRGFLVCVCVPECEGESCLGTDSVLEIEAQVHL